MFRMGTEWWAIALRTLLVYGGVIVLLRLAGKRELGQMTVFDLVVVLLLANAVQNAMTGPDFSVQGGLLAAAVLILVNRGVSVLRIRHGVWGRLLEGTPTVLVEDGRVIMPHLQREGIDEQELEMVVREHGIDSIRGVKMAILETDGTVSIVPGSAQIVRTHRRVRQLKKR
jgi:uncharacterized membrane protein YcaP (DUF421 family)